jgi:O-antigen/teichoic acid export membrane protein
MIRKVLGTFGSRIICTLIAFGIVIINSQVFGSSGLGTIGLFILGITILQNLTSFVGGPSLVYMLPRYDTFQLMFLSYVFHIIINIIGTLFLYAFHLIPTEYVWPLFFSSLFFSVYYINSQLILSNERIKAYNILAIIQIIIQLGLLVLLLFVGKIKDVSSYIYAYLISYVVVAILGFILAWNKILFKGFANIFSVLKQMLIYGFTIQAANFAQLLNYRLSYYIIEFCSGRKALGLFDLGTKLSEAVWILPKSMSTVQYARLSNCKGNKRYAKKLTLAFLKMAFVFALCATLILICIPSAWIGWIFGGEFMESKSVIYALALGIVILSCNVILSHYFSGFGKYKINTISSLIGLGITIGLGVSLISRFQQMSYTEVIFIMAWISSISYVGSFIWSFIYFIRTAKVKLSDLRIDKQDIKFLRSELKKILKNHN